MRIARCRALLFHLLCCVVWIWRVGNAEGGLKGSSTSSKRTETQQEIQNNKSSSSSSSRVTLNNGESFPLMGLGVGNLQHELILHEIEIAVGQDTMQYRLIDTAHASNNEKLVRDGIQNALASSSNNNKDAQVHVISKVWYTYLGYERTVLAIYEILGLFPKDDNISLHILLHWPRCNDDIAWMECEKEEDALPDHIKAAGPPPHLDKDNAFLESWQALEDMMQGKVKITELQDILPKEGERTSSLVSIGVSNFALEDMKALQTIWKIPPTIFQGNVWTFLFDPYLMNFLRDHEIHFQAYNVMNGIFGRSKETPNAMNALTQLATDLGQEYNIKEDDGISPHQLVLKWLTQQNVSVIPRTTRADHLQSNSPQALSRIPSLNQTVMDTVEQYVRALLTDQDVSPPTQAQASFHNKGTTSIALFWKDPNNGEQIPIGKVEPGESYKTNTFTGHTFLAFFGDDRSHQHSYTVSANPGEHEEFHVADEL